MNDSPSEQPVVLTSNPNDWTYERCCEYPAGAAAEIESLRTQIEILQRANRFLSEQIPPAPETSERQEMVVLRPCAIHQGMTFFATVGYRPPLREVCPGCEKWPPEVTSEKASEQCAPCAEGMNSFTDPDTGKKMHARNGTVTVCAAQKSDDGPHCKACGRGYGLHHDMCPVQPL